MPSLEERIEALSPALRQELARALDELERRHQSSRQKYLRQDWGGGLSHLKDKYTSLELQREAVDAWAGATEWTSWTPTSGWSVSSIRQELRR